MLHEGCVPYVWKAGGTKVGEEEAGGKGEVEGKRCGCDSRGVRGGGSGRGRVGFGAF